MMLSNKSKVSNPEKSSEIPGLKPINILPDTGFLRLPIILGNPKANPPIPAIIPVSKSAWWLGIKSGKFPAPVKLGPRTTAWKVEDIRELVVKLGA